MVRKDENRKYDLCFKPLRLALQLVVFGSTFSKKVDAVHVLSRKRFLNEKGVAVL